MADALPQGLPPLPPGAVLDPLPAAHQGSSLPPLPPGAKLDPLPGEAGDVGTPAGMAKALSEGKGDMPSFGDVKGSVATTAKPQGPTSVTAPVQAGGETTKVEAQTPSSPKEEVAPKTFDLGHGMTLDADGTMHDVNEPTWMKAGDVAEKPIVKGVEKGILTGESAVKSLGNPEVRSAIPKAIMPAVWSGLDNVVGGIAGGLDHLVFQSADSSVSKYINEKEAASNIPFLQKMGSAGLAVHHILDNPLQWVVDKSEADKQEVIDKLDPKVKALVTTPLGEHTNAAALVFNMTSLGTNFAASLLTGRAEAKAIGDIADASLVKIASQEGPRAVVARNYLARVQASRAAFMSGANQTLSVSGMSAADVESGIKQLTPEQFASTSPENAAAMNGKTPDEQRSYIDLRAEIAGDRTFMATMMLSIIAMKVPQSSISGELASNAMYGVATQTGENVGKKTIDKDHPLTEGDLTAGIVSGLVGTLVGRIGKALGAGETEGGLKEKEVLAAAKRKSLVAKVLAARPDITPEQREAILKQADVIDRHVKAGNTVHAGAAAGLTGEELETQTGRVDKTDKFRDAIADTIKRYIDASSDDKDKSRRISNVRTLDRWAHADGGRTQTESTVAFSHLIHTGELPPEVQEWSHEQVEGNTATQNEQPGEGSGKGNEADQVRPAADEGAKPAAGEERPASQVATPRSQPVIDKLGEEGVSADVKGNGRVVVAPNETDSEQAIKIAANDAAESPENERREPTPAQKAQGNYPKGRIMFASPKGNIPVDIENPAGSIRKSLPGAKPAWSRKMTEHYGNIPGTYSADGEPVDVIVGRKSHDDNLPIFVMQQTAKDGSFDEHKVVMGARSEREARDMYLKQYPASMHDELLQGQTKMVRFNRPQFMDWMKSGEHDVPINPMSKRPLLALRQSNGRLDGYFKIGTDHGKLEDIAGKLNDKFGTSLQVVPEGAGYRLSGDVPKAKVPAIHRSLQRQDGHEQTEFNGKPAGEVYPQPSEGNVRPVRAQPAVGKVDRGISGKPDEGEPHGDLSSRPGRSGSREGVSGNQEAPRPPRWLKKVKTDAPVYAKGKGKNPVSVVGVNYSTTPGLKTLDTAFAGTGSPGREVRRFGYGQPKTSDKHRMYFYVRQSNDLPVKETSVTGNNAYEARLDNLYDVHADPDGIMDRLERNGTRNADAVEEAVRKAGYDGVVTKGVANDTPVAQLIGPHNVPVKEVSDARYLFAGKKAAQAPDFARAEAMEKEGKSDREIHAETGWHKGNDGKWRFEIDDSKAKVGPMYGTAKNPSWPERALINDEQRLGSEGGVPLPEVYDHPELYQQYPFLKDIRVRVDDGLFVGSAYASPKEGIITMGDPRFGDSNDEPGAKKTLTHEINHLVEYHEGFARGGSVREFSKQREDAVKELREQRAKEIEDAFAARRQGDEAKAQEHEKRLDSIDNAIRAHIEETSGKPMFSKEVRMYRSLLGEIYARNAERRTELTAEQRATSYPEDTLPVQDRRDQIIAFHGENVPRQFKEPDDETDHAIPGSAEEGLRGRGRVSGGAGSLSQPRPAIAPLEGLPARVKVNGEVRNFGPSQVAHGAAEAYAKESGIPHTRPTAYAKVNEARAGRIARAYEAMEHAPNDPKVKKAYRAMIDETLAQWKQIAKTGLKVSFVKPGEAYPYKNPREVFEDLDKNNHMWVFPTTEGFGGSESAHVDISGNPLLEPTGVTIDGHPTVANDIFRIVHDYFGHYKEGVGFRAEGEENAWRAHAAMYSPEARRAMTTETRGQNSWVNYGPYGEFNKTASGEETQYAPQKVGLLPKWVSEEGRTEPYSPAQAKEHVDDLQSHVDDIRSSWKSGASAVVVGSRHELPEAIAKHLDTAIGSDADSEGVYYGGKVYLIGDAIEDHAHAERVLAHEMLGHYGLHATFGDELDNLLNEVHDSIKDTPEFGRIAKLYDKAYAGMDAREKANALTEEYLSDRVTLQASPSILSKVTAWFRKWARKYGLTSRWTDNDILNLMDGVARNVREGRASRQGWAGETATYGQDLVTRQSYSGAAGEGQIEHRLDGSRQVQVGDLKADVDRIVTEAGNGMLVTKVSYQNPADLLALTRLAGEEAKGYVLWPAKEEASLKAAGVPTERVGQYVQTPASRLDNQPARYSIRNQPEDKALADRINRVMGIPESSLSPWDRLQHWARRVAGVDNKVDRFVQANVDMLRSFAKAEMKINPKGTLLDASESAYKMGWMAQNTREVMGAVMHLGAPDYVDGSFVPVAGRKGLVDILSPLYQHSDKGFDRMWEFYAMARRSDQLQHMVNPDGTSKEKLLTPDDIKVGLELGEKYPVMKQVFADWQSFNHDLLDLAVKRGNMTPEMADLWKKNDYVPFYRVDEDGDGLNPHGQMPGGLKVSSKRLYGSNRQIEPLIENIIGNASTILRKVYKNEAFRRAAAVGQMAGTVERMPMGYKPVDMPVSEIEAKLEKMGMFIGQQANAQRGAKLQITPAQQDMWTKFFRAQAPMGDDVFSVMENGKAVYYKSTDDLFHNSINSLKKQEQVAKWWKIIMGGPKNFFTHVLTLNPAFMLRHLERQITHTFVQSGENFNPFSHAISNAHDAYTNSDFMQRMSMAGAGGNEYYDIDQMREALRGMGTHSTILDTGHKVWMAYRKIGFVADQMNRMGIAKSVLERGGSTAEAAWQAQDLLNFRMHGNSVLSRYLVSAVPLLNARVQGLYRIARGASGTDQSFRSRKASILSFAIKGAMLVAASQALAIHNNGDPRFERLPDEMKSNYWHIFLGNMHFAIAKPFEIGALFATLPDSAARYVEGLDGSHTFKQNLMRVFENVFRLDFNPALTTPITEDATNFDIYTQRPIVPETMQRVAPEAQENPFTSPSIAGMAHHMPEFLPDALRSPLRLQHLINGYMPGLGAYVIEAADAASRAAGFAPKAPMPRSNLPGGQATEDVLGSMVGRADNDPRNRYVNMVYEDKKKLDEIVNTIKDYKKKGDTESLNRYLLQHKTSFQYDNEIRGLYKAMDAFNTQEKFIYSSRTMTPEQKRQALDRITKERNDLLDKVSPILVKADSDLF